MVTRIAMWSGPRNISSAMMRSFEHRADTVVRDEPFYACYLRATGADHPGRDIIIASDTDPPHEVAESLLAPLPDQHSVSYQKHMAHHMTMGSPLDWVASVTNCFLIRDPSEVIASFAKVIPNPTMQDVGFAHQVALFDLVRSTSAQTPPVIDARDVLEEPRRTLTRLCDAIGIEFSESMLSWPAGPRPTDGPWAPFWYANVEASTGFAPYHPKDDPVPERLLGLLDRCRPLYEKLASEKL